MKIYAMI